ncbi:hypothetical protein MM326_13855 [Alkalihalobacillus sp. LMS6]|uniref:hypothetical protein n=1 Tax=Alkalihalobacillus sp. LMS6 TaxID=2924034 RepID=UPI0020D1C0F3|nr:hypothetical protein [Alkalihalobacillus sp. LMS6]UTR05187.1 hypothetical protein MM326_13855 [Alkalihalobacillus sp. LMS6]
MTALTGVKVIEAKAGVIEKVAYEGAEYVRVEESDATEAGNIVLINATNFRDAESGEYFESIQPDFDGDTYVRFKDNIDETQTRAVFRGNLTIFRKVETPAADLEARLSAVESDVAALQKRATSEVEGEGDAEEPLKVGDYVVALPTADDPYVITTTEMRLGKVTDTRGSGIIIEVLAHGYEDYVGRIHHVDSEHFRKATPAEVAAANTPKPAPPTFGDGDFAKVIGGTRYDDIEAGTIVKIDESERDHRGEIRIKLLDGSDYDYAKPSAIEKVSAEDGKWAKIKREKDEYKEGDLVRFLGAEGCHGLNDYEGITTIIESGGGFGEFILEVPEYLGELEYGTYTLPKSMELVTPVESRFDV